MRMHKFVGVPAQRLWATILVVLLFSVALSAQITLERTYGGTKADAAQSVQQTSDVGYIIVGATESYGAGGADVYLIKTNSAGDTFWTKTYGGTAWDWGLSVQQTSDGGYIITGWTESYGAGGSDVYLIKTDASGDILWARTYGGTTTDCGWSVQETQDGGYIITGHTYSYGAGGSDVYLIKTDASGKIVWTKTYGGTNDDVSASVQQTSDGGYIIAGFTLSYGAGGSDVYLIKTDASGKIVWTRTYGGANDDVCYSVQQTSDGGYIIAGWTLSYGAGGDIYLIKTNSSGDILWTRVYGGAKGEITRSSVQQTSDDSYIVAGYTYSYGAGGKDIYLIKTDSSGYTTWTRVYGGANDDDCYSVQQTTDGGYIIAGETESYGAGRGDVYLIKTDASGNVKMKLTQKELEKVVIITKVSEGSQAENVGLREDDIIVEYDGVQIITPKQLTEEKEKGLDKEQIVMVVIRDKEYKQFTLKGGEIGIHMEVTGVPEEQLPKEPSVVETLTGKPPTVLFLVKQNGKYGYIDKIGKIVINPQFDWAEDFSEGLASVKIGDKRGYIDKRGKYVIKPKFDVALSFSESLAKVKIGDKWGYIDETGEYVINPQFDDAYSFSKGLARVKIGDRYGYIDETGKIVINLQFDYAYDFSEGLALVRIGDRYGYIDETGKIVINPQFDDAYSFSKGLARVKIGDRWGYIDETGEYVINPQFDDAYSFSEGLARVKIGDRWGYIDETGKIVINPQFDDAYSFSEGLASVKIGDKWGYIDKSGKYAINPQFDAAYSFSKGLARVKIGDKRGYIDETGKYVVNPQFDAAYSFSEGLAKVKIGDKYGYIDETGKYVWAPTK